METKQLEIDIDHILESGANSIRLIELFKRYTTKQCEKIRRDCADNAKMVYHDGHGKVNHSTAYHQMGADNIQIDKQSILSTPITLT